MVLIHSNGAIDLDTILKNTGVLEILISDYSEVSRNLYPDVTNDNCVRLVIKTTKSGLFSGGDMVTIYKTYSEEDALSMKAKILEELGKGSGRFIISDYRKDD